MKSKKTPPLKIDIGFLANFFSSFNESNSIELLKWRQISIRPPEANFKTLSDFFSKIADFKTNLFYRPNHDFNIFKGVGLKELEVRHCHVLASAFQPYLNGSFARVLLLRILKSSKYSTEHTNNKKLLNTSNILSSASTDYRVVTQYYGTNGREIDIAVFCDAFTIFIEAKTNHTLSDKQLENYLEEIKRPIYGNHQNKFVILLTKSGNSHGITKKISEQIFQISWKEISRTIDELLTENPSISQQKQRMFYQDYADYIIKTFYK